MIADFTQNKFLLPSLLFHTTNDISAKKIGTQLRKDLWQHLGTFLFKILRQHVLNLPL